MLFRVAIPRVTVVLLVVGMSVLIGAAVAYFYVPSAVITVSPSTTTQTGAQDIIVSTKAQAPDFVRFILPARTVERTVEETVTIEREGSATHEDVARGDVLLTNEQDTEQPLLPKTNLRHEETGVFFLTDTAVTIPAKGTVHVTITAKEKGASGNVPAGKFIVDKLPSSLQKVVYATSQFPLSGGVAVDRPLTNAEIDTAKKRVRDTAEQRVAGELTAEAKGATIRSDLVKIETEDESVSAAPGSTTPIFRARVRLHARAFAIDDNDLLSLTVLSLQAKSNTDSEFVSYDPQSFTIAAKRLDFDRGEARLQGKLNGTYATKIGPTVFDETKLAGRTAAEVEEYFHQFPSVGKVETKLSPFWVKTVPSRRGATKIVVVSGK